MEEVEDRSGGACFTEGKPQHGMPLLPVGIKYFILDKNMLMEIVICPDPCYHNGTISTATWKKDAASHLFPLKKK